MKKIFLFMVLITSSLFAKNITIAVAANVSYAINDLIKEFNTINKDIKVRVILGSSGKLTAQIKNNAPYDLFMSANMMYPQTLFDENIAKTKPMVYAKGALVILSSKGKEFSQGINIAKNKKIKKIAIANPKIAPYGMAAIEALKNAKIYEDIKKKLVYAESISQSVAYTINATDLGFIAKSSLYSSKMSRFKENINWVDVNPKYYTPIKQGVVIIKQNKEAKKFNDFLFSKKAKDILKKYGYIVE